MATAWLQALQIIPRAVVYFLLISPVARAQGPSESFSDLAAKAKAAQNANDPQTAIQLYRKALDVNPTWQEGWWMAGSLQYEASLYKDGVESLHRLTVLHPNAGPALGLLGLCEYEIGRFEPALEHIQQGLAIGIGEQPQMTLVLKFHEAALLAKIGKFDTALQKYSGFLPDEVQDEQVLLSLGLTALRQAAVPFEIPATRKQMYADAGRATVAFLAHDQAQAQAAYEQLLVRYPDDPGVHYAYGYFIFGINPDRAIREWQRSLTLDPTNGGAHAMLSWAYWLRDESEQAFRHAQAAVDKDPNAAIARIVLGRSLVKNGQADAGLRHLQYAVSIEPANLEAHLALASAYSETGHKTDALRERQLCLQMQAEAGPLARR